MAAARRRLCDKPRLANDGYVVTGCGAGAGTGRLRSVRGKGVAGYDHSNHFIATFMPDRVACHAERLRRGWTRPSTTPERCREPAEILERRAGATIEATDGRGSYGVGAKDAAPVVRDRGGANPPVRATTGGRSGRSSYYELTKERGQVTVEDIIRGTSAARGTVKNHLPPDDERLSRAARRWNVSVALTSRRRTPGCARGVP